MKPTTEAYLGNQAFKYSVKCAPLHYGDAACLLWFLSDQCLLPFARLQSTGLPAVKVGINNDNCEVSQQMKGKIIHETQQTPDVSPMLL